MGLGGQLRRGAAVTAVALACEVAPPDDDILPPDGTAPELAPCTPNESASLRAALAPAPAGERVDLVCEIAGRSEGSGSFALGLICDQPRQLIVEVTPAPTGDGLQVGRAVRVTRIEAPTAPGEADVWLRVEAASGGLLLATASGGRVDPPDGTGWASPFAWREATGTCMVEETACGASQRGALDLQLSGGPPVRLYDGTSAVVGDDGAFAAFVEAARVAPPGSGCAPAFAFGVMATR